MRIGTVPPAVPGMAGTVAAGTAGAARNGDFAAMLRDALADVNNLQLDAEEAARQLAAGEAGDLHQVMLAAEKANLSLQLTVQIRNKLLEAYQEIMRMQV